MICMLLAKIDLTTGIYHQCKSQVNPSRRSRVIIRMPFKAKYKMAAMAAIVNFMVAKINRVFPILRSIIYENSKSICPGVHLETTTQCKNQ